MSRAYDLTTAQVLAATSLQTNTVTPTPGRLVFIGVANRLPGTSVPTLSYSGTNLTITQVGTLQWQASNDQTFTLFRALATPSTTSGKFTADFGASTQEHITICVIEVAALITTGTNGADAIVQAVFANSNPNDITGGTEWTINLSAFAASKNATLGFFTTGSVLTPGTGFAQVDQAPNDSSCQQMSEFRVDNDTTVSASPASNGRMGGVALELNVDNTGPVPTDIIIPWPSTAASIPTGWARETALDGIFLKGVPNGSTDPGTTGGAATHSHTTASHTHTTTHGHPLSGNMSSASGSRSDGNGSISASSTHDHTNPASVASASPGASGGATPGTTSQSNDPANLVVIFIKSDGSPKGIPNNALALFNFQTPPTGWTQYANSKDNFLKGAAAAGDGGGTNAGNSSHTHTTTAHSHSVPAHTHAASGTSGVAAAGSGASGASAGAGTSHTHTVSGASNSATTSTTVQSETASGSGSSEPPYYKLLIAQNTTGAESFPQPLIAIWLGTLATIPAGWVLCDGNNGTPNLLGKYVKGANATSEVGNTGGSATHTHTDPSTHTHPMGSGFHTGTVSAESGSTNTATSGAANGSTTGHTHSATTDASTDSTGTGTAGTYDTPNSEPSNVTVAFIMKSARSLTPFQNPWRRWSRRRAA